MQETGKPPTPRSNPLRSAILNAPWNVAYGATRLLYGFRVDGAENIPEEGPYIIWFTEPSVLATIVNGYLSIKKLHDAMERSTVNVSFFHEELFRLAYFKRATGDRNRFLPSVPGAAAHMAKGMLDGYRALQNKGLVINNPQGDAPWDGRPVPFGRLMAWLALRTAAQIVPVLCPVGAYEIWPRWQSGPSRKGRLKVEIGKPFRLVETPLERVSDQDIEEANRRLLAYFEKSEYGPGGLAGWVGPNLRDGVELRGPVRLGPPPTVLAALPAELGKIKPTKRGIALLLWQCPICRTNDALLHRRPRVGRERVECKACGTEWDFSREPGRDFRMKVVEGAAEHVGLEMALSSWHELMRESFAPAPIQVEDAQLHPGEEVYLEAQGVALAPYRPNPLFEGWTGREPPSKQTGLLEIAGWDEVGRGRLVLTGRRLIWEGEQGGLDFEWGLVSNPSLYMNTVLAIGYGRAKYRFNLSGEIPRMWLGHAEYLAARATGTGAR